MATVRRRHWTTTSGAPKSGWQLAYTDGDGRRHRKLYKTKAAADAARVRIEGEIDPEPRKRGRRALAAPSAKQVESRLPQ